MLAPSVDTMNAPKTTVVGIRLDPERRGWIEAEAARQGVSIRTYFERMIDEARYGGQEEPEPEEPIVSEPVLDAGSDVHETAAHATSETRSAGEPGSSAEQPVGASTGSTTAPPGLSEELVSSFERMLDEARSGGQERVEHGLSDELVSSFERMLDEAGFGSQDEVEPEESIAWEPALDVDAELYDQIAAPATTEAWSAGQSDPFPKPPLGASAASSTAPTGLCDDLVSVTTMPCRVIRDALGLSRALIHAVTRPFRRNRAF